MMKIGNASGTSDRIVPNGKIDIYARDIYVHTENDPKLYSRQRSYFPSGKRI